MVDREKRARLLAAHRRKQNRRHAQLTPAERLEKSEAMRVLAHSLHPKHASKTDESRELLLAMKARLRGI